MKVLYPNLATAAALDFENANFPASNVLDEHPKRLAKGTQSSVILSISVSSGCNTVALFNTNADTVSVETRNGSTVEWESDVSWGESAWDIGSSAIYSNNPV